MVDPILALLAYPVGLAVSNAIGKYIDYKWTQPRSHKNYLEGLSAQHSLRLEEIRRQHEQNIVQAYVNSELRINEQIILETLRASCSVQVTKAIKEMARTEENSPFYDGLEVTRDRLISLYQQTGLPIVLVAPFWDDTQPRESNDRGGYVDFRNAFSISYSRAAWHELAPRKDGYIKRPLYQTDRDVDYIYSVLSDVPTILIHGTIQGVHSPQQYVQRIHPHITFWNLLPDQQDGYTSLDLKFIPIQFPAGTGQQSNIAREIGEYSLKLQDQVGEYTAKAVGLLSSCYHLWKFHTRPNLQQFQLENEQELAALSFEIERLYDRLSVKHPELSGYFMTEKSTLIMEQEITRLQESKPSPRFWLMEKLGEMSKTLSLANRYVLEQNLPGDWSTCFALTNDKLSNEASKLSQDKFRILVIGNFNRGKSSVINALLGQSLLPVGVTATTTIPT
jgi:Dynamin family